LNQFGNQKGEVFKEENFDIRTIEPKQGFELGYEITSLVSSCSSQSSLQERICVTFHGIQLYRLRTAVIT
jgi:hypothetical protein